MVTGVLEAVSMMASMFPQASSADSGATVNPLWPVAVLGLTAAVVWGVRNMRQLNGKIAALAAENAKMMAEFKQVGDKEKRLARELEDRQKEIKEIKQEVAVQRKKTHEAQEETRKVRADTREQLRSLEESISSRPAFAEIPEPKPVVTKAVVKVVEAPAEPVAPKIIETVVYKPSPESLARLSAVEAELRDERAKHQLDREALLQVKTELKRVRRRCEDYRRVDIISKSKVELLEDKLGHISREYYESISELAALKGQVKPPMPRGIKVEARPTAAEDKMAEQQALSEDDHQEHDVAI